MKEPIPDAVKKEAMRNVYRKAMDGDVYASILWLGLRNMKNSPLLHATDDEVDNWDMHFGYDDIYYKPTS